MTSQNALTSCVLAAALCLGCSVMPTQDTMPSLRLPELALPRFIPRTGPPIAIPRTGPPIALPADVSDELGMLGLVFMCGIVPAPHPHDGPLAAETRFRTKISYYKEIVYLLPGLLAVYLFFMLGSEVALPGTPNRPQRRPQGLRHQQPIGATISLARRIPRF